MTKRLIIILFSLLHLTSCKNTDRQTALSKLQVGESIISFKIGGEEFYNKNNIFSGEVLVMDQVLRINFFDQYKSNFILSFEEKNKYLVKPYKKRIFADNQVAASVMAGKLVDSLAETGIGYLLADGFIEVLECDQESMKIKIHGKGAKFESFEVPDKWEKIEGQIIIRKPRYQFAGIESNEFYYTPK